MKEQILKEFKELISKIEEGDYDITAENFFEVLEKNNVEIPGAVIGYCLHCDCKLTKDNVFYNSENEPMYCKKHAYMCSSY